ncbi:hypothetical protein ACHAWF_007653 [Thalassiosira exigua]
MLISFVTSRVKRPNLDNWGKSRRCLKYRKGMNNIKPTLFVDDLGVGGLLTLCDPDMRGQVGGMMSTGKGAIINGSSKTKINTDSSTITELVGIRMTT